MANIPVSYLVTKNEIFMKCNLAKMCKQLQARGTKQEVAENVL